MSQPISMAHGFSVDLGVRLGEGLGVVAPFDGSTPSFVGATSNGLIAVHDSTQTEPGRAVRHHNLNRPLTSLDACIFNSSAAPAASSGNNDGAASTDFTSNTATSGGPAPGQKKKASLLLGSQTSLLVYDVHDNADVFFKEVPDGVNTVSSGAVWRGGSTAGGSASMMTALVGGNGSVQGFDGQGQENWWTVAGDNVGAVAVVPTSDYSSTVAVGTDDFEIRFYEGETLAGQVTETDRIVRLKSAAPPIPFAAAHLSRKAAAAAAAAQRAGGGAATSSQQQSSGVSNLSHVAYGLGNGTIGVYDAQQRARKWRYKSKNKPTSLAFGDVDGDGVDELIVGWSNGRVEVRATGGGGDRNGECIFKETLAAPIAAVAAADYRRVNREMPVVATCGGELLGFVPIEGASDRIVHSSNQLVQLMEQKAALEHQIAATLKSATEAEAALSGAMSAAMHTATQGAAAAASVEVSASLLPNPRRRALTLVVHASNDTPIQSVMAQADVVFGGTNDAIYAANPAPGAPTMQLHLETVKDMPGELHVAVTLQRRGAASAATTATSAAANSNRAGGGASAASAPANNNNNSNFLEVRHIVCKMPKFAMYAPLTEKPLPSLIPQGVITSRISERTNRLITWAQSSFIGFTKANVLSQPEQQRAATATSSSTTNIQHFEAYFQCLRRPQKQKNQHRQQQHSSSSSASADAAPRIVGVIASALDGELRILCDDMETAGDFIEDLCAYMSIGQLGSRAQLPDEFGRLGDTVAMVGDLNEARLKLTAEMADVTQLVKALIVKLEDARTVGDFKTMRRTLDSLFEVNRELMGEHLKRSTNHVELQACMKAINVMIQGASRLRVGEARNVVVQQSRQAVLEENMSVMATIFAEGARGQ